MRQDQSIQLDGDLSLTAMDGTNVAELTFAGDVCFLLSTIYPGHPFCVESHEGDVRIRHLALSKFGSYCYYISPLDMLTPTSLKKALVKGGGEILDRLNLPRDKPWDGQVPVMIDDVDIKYLRKDQDEMNYSAPSKDNKDEAARIILNNQHNFDESIVNGAKEYAGLILPDRMH